jgi:prepilin-type N-terminal cleavage/methylation domain-containing protein
MMQKIETKKENKIQAQMGFPRSRFWPCNNVAKATRPKFTTGFTLVELIVAVAVFTVVMTISLGSVLSILDAGRKAKALKTIMTNLNFSLEVMTKEIKFGKNYACGVAPNTPDITVPHVSTRNCTGNPTAPDSSITFTSSEGNGIIYRLSANGKQIEKAISVGGAAFGPYITVTSREVTITNLKFYVFGSTVGDSLQPRMLILVQGYAGTKASLQSKFSLQTTASQRSLDR